MILSDSARRSTRTPPPSSGRPIIARSASAEGRPAPIPSSNRPPVSRSRLAASFASMTGRREGGERRERVLQAVGNHQAREAELFDPSSLLDPLLAQPCRGRDHPEPKLLGRPLHLRST